jgi:hypothetical protein
MADLHPVYTVNFAGAPMDIYDIDDLMKRAWEGWEEDPSLSFSTLAIAPDLRENLRHALMYLRPLEPRNYEIHEVKHLKTRWGSVDVVIDDTLPMHHMTLR